MAPNTNLYKALQQLKSAASTGGAAEEAARNAAFPVFHKAVVEKASRVLWSRGGAIEAEVVAARLFEKTREKLPECKALNEGNAPDVGAKQLTRCVGTASIFGAIDLKRRHEAQERKAARLALEPEVPGVDEGELAAQREAIELAAERASRLRDADELGYVRREADKLKVSKNPEKLRQGVELWRLVAEGESQFEAGIIVYGANPALTGQRRRKVQNRVSAAVDRARSAIGLGAKLCLDREEDEVVAEALRVLVRSLKGKQT